MLIDCYYFVMQEKEMEFDSLREKARRDSEGLSKKLQVFILGQPIRYSWKAVPDFLKVRNIAFSP